MFDEKSNCEQNDCSWIYIFIFWVADWFALLNHKLGGDLENIRIVGQYFIEVWKSAGMDMNRVKFLWASEEIKKRHDVYWDAVFDIATRFGLTRIKKCCQIMGRHDEDKLFASQIFYPVMQAADIFFLGVDVCQLGMDQRKVNMLARDYVTENNTNDKIKPIILSHPMLPGLKKGQEKMSKSDPKSSIYVDDTVEDVNDKIKGAFCPEESLKGNPCISYLQHIIFPNFPEGIDVIIESSTVHFKSFEEFAPEYKNKKIQPQELKLVLSQYINLLLEPIRKHFKENKEAQALLKRVIDLRAST